VSCLGEGSRESKYTLVHHGQGLQEMGADGGKKIFKAFAKKQV
jgi:hydrogenase maturation factor